MHVCAWHVASLLKGCVHGMLLHYFIVFLLCALCLHHLHYKYCTMAINLITQYYDIDDWIISVYFTLSYLPVNFNVPKTSVLISNHHR